MFRHWSEEASLRAPLGVHSSAWVVLKGSHFYALLLTLHRAVVSISIGGLLLHAHQQGVSMSFFSVGAGKCKVRTA